MPFSLMMSLIVSLLLLGLCIFCWDFVFSVGVNKKGKVNRQKHTLIVICKSKIERHFKSVSQSHDIISVNKYRESTIAVTSCQSDAGCL